MFYRLIFFLICISSSSGHAVNLGELSSPEIFSVNQQAALSYKTYKALKNYQTDEDYFYDNFYYSEIRGKAEGFLNFWVKDYLPNSSCPKDDFDKHKGYIRFLFRLVSLSLIFETLEEVKYLKAKLNLSYKKLANIELLVKRCRPSTQDMKKFLSRAIGYRGEIAIGEFFKSQKKTFFNNIKKNYFLGLLACREDECSERILIENLDVLYWQLVSDFQKVCSEQDSLYGLSKLKGFMLNIYSSSAIEVIDDYDKRLSCVKKFVRENKHLEPNERDLLDRLNFIEESKKNKSFVSQKDTGALGPLFNFGALKYFDNLGIGDLILEEVKVSKIKKPIEIKKVFKVIKKKVKKKKVVKKIAKIEKKIEKITKRISAFESALEVFQSSKSPVFIDMVKFESDYQEAKIKLSEIKKPLESFQTQKSLKVMKELDLLGERKQPFPLIFLKYLIDFDYHQGLFNVVRIIGSEFYVINDFEKKKDPVKIRLINDLTTNYRWVIQII